MTSTKSAKTLKRATNTSKKVAAKKVAKVSSLSKEATMAKVVAVVKDRGHQLRSLSDVEVLQVRPGYLFRNNRITSEPAVVVVINPRDRGRKNSFPKRLRGVPVQVRMATPVEQLQQFAPEADPGSSVVGVATTEDADLARPGWDLMESADVNSTGGDPGISADDFSGLAEYVPPAGVKLLKFKDAMTVTCHVRPCRTSASASHPLFS